MSAFSLSNSSSRKVTLLMGLWMLERSTIHSSDTDIVGEVHIPSLYRDLSSSLVYGRSIIWSDDSASSRRFRWSLVPLWVADETAEIDQTYMKLPTFYVLFFHVSKLETVFESLKVVVECPFSWLPLFKDKNGKYCQDTDAQLKHWLEYFCELINRFPPWCNSYYNLIPKWTHQKTGWWH